MRGAISIKGPRWLRYVNWWAPLVPLPAGCLASASCLGPGSPGNRSLGNKSRALSSSHFPVSHRFPGAAHAPKGPETDYRIQLPSSASTRKTSRYRPNTRTLNAFCAQVGRDGMLRDPDINSDVSPHPTSRLGRRTKHHGATGLDSREGVGRRFLSVGSRVG